MIGDGIGQNPIWIDRADAFSGDGEAAWKALTPRDEGRMHQNGQDDSDAAPNGRSDKVRFASCLMKSRRRLMMRASSCPVRSLVMPYFAPMSSSVSGVSDKSGCGECLPLAHVVFT